MSAIMASITGWKDRQLAADNLDSQGRRRNSDRTPVASVPLRDIAARQGAILRAACSTGRSAARIDMDARVAAVRAAQAAPAPVARPAVASVPQGKARPDFKRINELCNAIPTGFYALPARDGATNAAQPTYYFKVHKWGKGHRIVMVTGGVGAFREIPMKAAWQLRALEGIAADPKAAAVLFGRETGQCGRCGSPLTSADSRAAGLGPKCRTMV